MVRVRSGSDLSAITLETRQGTDRKVKEETFKAQIGPELGFDL